MDSSRAIVFLVIFISAMDTKCLGFIIPDQSNEVLANTSYGMVRGKVFQTPSKNDFYAFLDIPYATPPVGKLRFQRPLPPKSWKGILDTTENRKICWEMRVLTVKLKDDPRENEDCLYLNVYVPKSPSNKEKLLPVLVYITGGMYLFNDGTFKSYKPYNFIERDVIMVSMNFRQGPLGFLTTNDSTIPGNVGLWDQNMALRWVQDNIEMFGGDPKKVTLMGHSSGAGCITFHMLSKKSNGLFNAAIVESGASIGRGSIQPFPKYFAYRLAHAIDPKITHNNTSEELLQFLQSVSPSIISNVTKLHPDPEYDIQVLPGKSYELLWKPILESRDDQDAFLTNAIHDAFKEGNFNQVPVLTGITSEEDGAIAEYSWTMDHARIVDEHPELVYDKITGIKKERRSAFWQELKAVYTKDPFQKNFTGFIKMSGDLQFANPVSRFADLISQYVNVYFYQFSYFGPMNLHLDIFDMEGLGKAPHCAELAYLVYYKLDGDTKSYPESDIKMRHTLSDLFANFIKYQNPTPKKEPQLQNIIWPKFDSEALLYLDIDNNLTIKESPRYYRQCRKIIDKYYEHPLINI